MVKILEAFENVEPAIDIGNNVKLVSLEGRKPDLADEYFDHTTKPSVLRNALNQAVRSQFDSAPASFTARFN
jgi:hypothetical protein